MNNKLASSTAIGYGGLFIAGWLISMVYAGWFALPVPHAGIVTGLIVGGILVAIAGIMDYFQGKTQEMTLFLGLGAFFFTYALTPMTATQGAMASLYSAYGGWSALVWAVFFFILWIAALKTGVGTFKNIYLLGLWLLFVAAAIGDWAMSSVFYIILGYIGLVDALIAAYISFSEMSSSKEAATAE